jgi:preprotein translocase subunit SecD
MNADVKRRIAILAAVFVTALLFLYPTISVITKKITGTEITAEDLIGGGWISRPISLGLDLSGGVHLVYEVVAREAVTARLQSEATSLRSELRREKVPVTRAVVNSKNEIEITLLTDRTLEKAKKIIQENSRLEYRGIDSESGRVKIRYGISEQEVQSIEDTAVSQAVETLRNRVDQFGVSEPLIQRVGTRRINLQMPGVKDIEAVKQVVGKVAKLEFRFLPRTGSTDGTITIKDKEGSPVQVEDVVQLTGAAVEDARVSFLDAELEVGLTLTAEGGRQFAKLTGDNVGRNLAIILDGVLYSSPVIRERISGGRCSISGGFRMDEAKQLAVVLRAGALPAPLEVLEERTVGPTLGAESIRRGVIAIVIGFILILVFMALYYRKCGVVAAVILALNILFVLAALSAFGATLTLPGLAGLALTVGMAVDANVIIFERIREEVDNGSSRDAAVDSGFGKAFSAIIDSNVTTLLVGLILYYFGSGPIRGFAVTLCIGILTTIFCATFVARLAFDAFELRSKDGISI